MNNLSKSCKVTRVAAGAVAGTSDINSSSVDMTGFDSVAFIVSVGVITAGAATSAYLETSSDDSSFNALLGTGVTIADTDDDGVVILDLHAPLERYIRCTLARATQNAVSDGIVAIQYNAASSPTTHDATSVIGSEFHLGPAEGTA